MSNRDVGARIARIAEWLDEPNPEDEPDHFSACPECNAKRLSPWRDDSPWRFCLACGYYEERA